MALSDKTVQAAKPKDKPYKLGDDGGLFLLVSPAGGKLWKLKYRYHGKEKKLSLGAYPAISLSDARERTRDARKLLANDTDPSAYKQQVKSERLVQDKNTFEAIARAWHAQNLSGWKSNTASYSLRRLEADIFPQFGNVPIKQVTAQHVIAAIRLIEARNAHEVARRMKQMCGQVFRYAIVEGLTETNPVVTFESKDALKPYAKGHYAAFDARELPAFMQKLERNDARLYAHTRLAMKLLALTFVRTSELIQATWDEFHLDEKQWVIPKERMKMGREHLVPLCKQALEILEDLKKYRAPRPAHATWPDYVFPSQINPRKCMSNNTILKALERMGYKGDMTGHGFRSLAMSTIKEKLGYRHEVVDRQLAHAHGNKVDAAYDRAKFLDERKVMMQAWGDYLDKQATGGKALYFRH
ncbi:MAG: integrase arm-type DNA-binding domain-containing protein [Alphaproteobacteria bacterium]